MKSFDEPCPTDDPAWSVVQQWIASACNHVEALSPPEDMRVREATLVATQVTTRSAMGAIVSETGGLLVDHGWVRVLGGGHPRLPRTLPGWNVSRADGFYLVADDVLGGFFALDGGALGGTAGHVRYFAPDTLRWEPMAEMGYSAFAQWLLSGDVARFYETYRWQGWEGDIASLSGDRVMGVYPPLWTVEGRDISRATRRSIPITEAYDLNVVELPRQLDSPE